MRFIWRAHDNIRKIVKSAVPPGSLEKMLDLYARLDALLYRGRGVECPCCGGRFRRFKSYGAEKRRNALCPRCRSMERQRLAWLFLERETDFFTGDLRVLHFAPEFWMRRRFSSMDNIEYVSADLDSPLASLKTDITDIVCGDASFDAIICIHVLEHVEDDGSAMRELYRVVRPGGWALVQVPLDTGRARTLEDSGAVSEKDRLRLYGKEDHVRIYGLDISERLEAAGFAVDSRAYGRELGQAVRDRYGLRENHYIFLAGRPAE
jgi:SAM-dependent methyltransferase